MKYIVDIREEYVDEGEHLKVPVIIGGADATAWVTTDIVLRPWLDPDLETARKEAYNEGYTACLSGAKSPCGICREYQRGISEGREQAWEKKQKEDEEIKAGDVVVHVDGAPTYIVTEVAEYNDGSGRKAVRGIMHNGGWTFALSGKVRKTGCHFPEIAEALSKIGEGNGTTRIDTEEIRNKAFDDGFKEGMSFSIGDAEKIEEYKKGLKEGRKQMWQAARKIVAEPPEGGLSVHKIHEIFGTGSPVCIITENTADEAIEKISAWEKGIKKVKVGDEIEDGVANLIVTHVNSDGTVEGLADDGSVLSAHVKSRTGRHFPEIAEVLSRMREVSE